MVPYLTILSQGGFFFDKKIKASFADFFGSSFSLVTPLPPTNNAAAATAVDGPVIPDWPAEWVGPQWTASSSQPLILILIDPGCRALVHTICVICGGWSGHPFIKSDLADEKKNAVKLGRKRGNRGSK